ncbi:MAG: N-(5'-phosphoribosyl)anthranilate isomerase [Candidatus Hydrogenedentes bacterium ADurb.Bin101]|nr:MAG: N-(5'-phosphoribosyl)anthranilate isomerase [Candidatus Hydrogenedentes bacterium ADurb.Bin101]HOC69721.1 phosphoribosylanthranilate isomerase [Candidatus Hydrogenedentota bacterium]HOH29705.1 phosphoribosylanthranilate isomerase [Candidatus Hydrogenedentota bacterium]
MMTKIKICGITNVEDALVACEAGADALGFVLAPEAKRRNRYIELEAAAAIIARLPEFVTTVGVVVNETVERMREMLRVFDRLQLHGNESAEICAAIGPRAYKAFRIHEGFNKEEVTAFPGILCLLDAWSADAHGGTGCRCDWQIAIEVGHVKKIVLAGGLTPENVEEAVLRVHPYAVDVSGGLEDAPGKKDHEKIHTFIYNVRKASLA